MKDKIIGFFEQGKTWTLFIVAIALNSILFERISFIVSQIRIVSIYVSMALLYELIVKIASKNKI